MKPLSRIPGPAPDIIDAFQTIINVKECKATVQVAVYLCDLDRQRFLRAQVPNMYRYYNLDVLLFVYISQRKLENVIHIDCPFYHFIIVYC